MAHPDLTDILPQPRNAKSGFRGLLVLLALGNVIAWLWAIAAFHGSPVLLGTALVAYGLGLRHAVDADHIAAIDNVTRKLRQEGHRPHSVGLFFSLGHSSVVVLATMLLVAGTDAFRTEFEQMREIGGLFGTIVSAGFLFAIAAVNLTVLFGIVRAMRSPETTPPASTGLLSRWLKPLFRLIGRSWHMYPLGMLFAFGFDTASEIGLLGLSAGEAARGLSVWAILSLPLLFTAGMSLVDTADGIFMLHAYDWAFAAPKRRLTYNFLVTLLSVIVALLVGTIELLGIVTSPDADDGVFAQAIDAANQNFTAIGYLIIALFVALWGMSVILSRLRAGRRVTAS
jgi:high-affinity nickel-transport protein